MSAQTNSGSGIYTVVRPRAVAGVAEAVYGGVGPGSDGHPAHWHSEWQLVAVTDGDGWVRTNSGKHRTPAGSLFLIPPEEVHSNGVFDTGCKFRSILIDPDLVDEVAAAEGLSPGRSIIRMDPVWVSKNVTSRFDTFHHRLVNEVSSLELDTAMGSCLSDFLQMKTGVVAEPVSRTNHPAARKAREYIWSNAEQNFSLEELAIAVGLSRFELIRQFKGAYGMPPHAWQLQVRVEIGKNLLKRGERAGEVALRLGFADQAHFSRVFKKATGYPPGRYYSEFLK